MRLSRSGPASPIGFITCSFPTRINCLFEGVVVMVVHLLSCVLLFVTPWTASHQASLTFTISWSLLKSMSTAAFLPVCLLPGNFLKKKNVNLVGCVRPSLLCTDSLVVARGLQSAQAQ